MTARPDLAALARELRHALVVDPADPLPFNREWVERAASILSEPAAEADGPHVLVHKQLLAQLTEERDALRAQLAAAAPLFEAAHDYDRNDHADDCLAAASQWARSDAGQRWKGERK